MATEDDVDDFLAHYGVKGMKWGKRKAARAEAKAARRQRDQDIIDARVRSHGRAAKLDAAIIDASYAQSPEVQKRANNLVKKYMKEIQDNPDDAIMAEKMTTGEKWASGISIGLSVAAIAGYGTVLATSRSY